MILAKVPNFTPECLWIVGFVYVGHSGATTNYSRREAFASIQQALDRVVPFDNNHPVLIFGDWNTDPQRLQRIVHSWGHGLTVMQFSGSQITRLSTVHGRRHSSIDHFVCNAPARALLTSPRVDRQTAVADHFVICTSIRAETQGQPPVPRAPIISRHHCLKATDRIATSNYWDVLVDGATDDTDTDTDIHQLTSQFLESANAVADNLSLRLSPPATRSNRRLLSGATKRAILASNTARQAFIAAATHTNPDPVQCNTLRDEWSRLKAAATQLERADGRKQWVKHADDLDRAVSDGRTDLVFAAARAMSGNSSRSAAVTPLYNSNGIVQYDPTSILRVMQCHYGSLAADTTGHSLDLQYWHDRQPIQVSRDTPLIRNSDILDQDFSWNQIAATLLQMSPRKAPGDDGITTAFYQAALYMPANTQEGVPPTPFARALLRVCGQVFASATIPRAWLCASIVSIDKKDGDPLNPGDKRGIALINVGLKLVCKVLQMRIERFVETNNLLSYEQAGFRKRKECVGQVVSLVDIIQRRQNAGLNTHVLFIDIRKAFDTVPVGALLWKLQNMGFPRRTLAFLKALYTSSSARARAGSLLSDPFPVQRGVRQGCPLSGLLFNLFINDILDGVAPITVPGLPRDTNPIRGLMYADDVAVFADSEQSLLAASTAVERWANQWEMQFGVAKCGIISFTGHLAPRLDNPLDIRLHGQLVSRVESYKYLGVLIDSKLDHSAWLKQKRSALEHTISALHPVLANHQLTVNYRSRIFSAVVMGKAYYGLELVGGNKSHLAPLQTTINKGIRLFTGARLSTAIGPLLVETGIGSLLTRSLVSRGQLVRSQRWFWSRRTKQLYRNRYWLTPQVRPKTVKQRHSFALMETLQTCGDSASLQKYVTRQLLDTSGFFKDPSFDQSRAHGTRYLMLARMDALWTARKAIQIGILVDTHPFSVDHCILCDQQLLSTSIAHLVVECKQVTGHRIQSGLVPAIQKSRLRLLGRALDPGVENVYTWLRGGVLNGEADLDQRWLDGTVEHESMGTRHDNRALAARLADFLQFIQKKTTNYSRREAFASIRQALDRVVPFDNNHPVLIFGDWNTDPQRLQRIVHSWGHGLTVMQFSGSQITRLSTVHGRRHSSIDHFVCNAPARALLTSPPTDRIATSNYWDVLADGATDDTDTDTNIHQLTSQFLESANAVADNLSLRLSPPATRFNRRLLSGATKRAILASNTARQAFIAVATHTNPDPVHCSTLRDEWSRLKATATQLERVDGRKQWVKHADNLDRAVSDGRTDLVFAAARAMSGNSSRSAAVTPLYTSDGIVQYDPTSILRVMQGHYGSLAADTTGHSLDLQYWHDRQPIQASPNTPTIRNSEILDQDFSWNQIAAALLQMSPRKAPGDDGITTAFYQAALYMPANTQEGVPPTPFARALLRVCGQVFASATIPRAWLCASIVSIDKKDGDPLNPGDKRGIALINVGLKLVCKVLQMRIERFVETKNLLSYEQAGFRKRKECVGQVVSLVDIIQRRQNAGLNTHVLFIDIRKAFDTVPVGALLWKLQNMGFPRRTLAFLKALYTSSSARARAGSLLSDPFPVQRGVRQGCPLSGLLFNLFINDILDGVAPITVPGLPRDTNPIRGLMYADDVAVFADSEQSLLAASTAVEQWANQWEMQFGVAKCGIISFTGHLAPRLDNPLDIRLHGQLVSRVESYKYLGVLIDSKLDHSAWLKQKRSALEHTISALHPVLANHQLTVNYRSRIFSAVVMGKAYYGLELVGGNKSHLAPLQTTINKGIRLFTGARLSTAIGPLLVETGIDSLLTRSLVSRVRLLERSVTKRTPINAICSGTDNDVFTLNVQGQLVRSQRWFLVSSDQTAVQEQILADTTSQTKDSQATTLVCIDGNSTNMWGLCIAPKLIHCILCNRQLLSTSIAHLVVECEQVTGHRIQSGLVPAIQKSRLRLLGRALDPGVENVYTWLRGEVLNGEADLDQRWLDGTVEHESMGTRHDNRALAARLADFLQVAYRQYQSILWKYHRDRLVEVG
ncbi:hypothetical protein BASA83_000663 [Batrachochytrium salamandrivorans]|nr:hypothetical protein BASA83_000663 [Batrachochytrium salamandrivorans]